MEFEVDKYFDSFKKEKIIYAYKGSISLEVINDALDMVENGLGFDLILNKKRLYSVLVECLQNLLHHTDIVPEAYSGLLNPKFGVIIIYYENESVKILTGNFIKADRIRNLQNKINKVNSMTKDELKDIYKSILNHQRLSHKGGGGLGLVDIRRKTENEIGFRLLEVDKEHFFSEIIITVN